MGRKGINKVEFQYSYGILKKRGKTLLGVIASEAKQSYS